MATIPRAWSVRPDRLAAGQGIVARELGEDDPWPELTDAHVADHEVALCRSWQRVGTSGAVKERHARRRTC